MERLLYQGIVVRRKMKEREVNHSDTRSVRIRLGMHCFSILSLSLTWSAIRTIYWRDQYEQGPGHDVLPQRIKHVNL
jgi:hypothetical protein